MDIRQQIDEDIKRAMRARDKARLAVLRFVLADIKQREVDTRAPLTNDEVLSILVKQAKRRRESIEQYERGGRHDLARKEQFELEQVQSYLPEPLSEEALSAMISESIAQAQATQISDMGNVMARLKAKVQGRAEMKQVSQRVREALQSAAPRGAHSDTDE